MSEAEINKIEWELDRNGDKEDDADVDENVIATMNGPVYFYYIQTGEIFQSLKSVDKLSEYVWKQCLDIRANRIRTNNNNEIKKSNK